MDFLLKLTGLLRGERGLDLKQALKEKRFFPRVRCAVEARCTTEKKQNFLVSIVEFSIEGMRLYSPKKLKSGEMIEIGALKGTDGGIGGTVKMRTIWCRKKPTTNDYIAGLQYEDTRKNLQDSWIARLLKNYSVSVGLSPQKRRKVRIPANLPLSISFALKSIEGRIEDMGIGGMLFTSDQSLSLHEILRFRIGPYEHMKHLFCNGRILRERYVHSSQKWVYGVVFQEMNEKQSQLLSDYLRVLCLEHRE